MKKFRYLEESNITRPLPRINNSIWYLDTPKYNKIYKKY